MKKNNVSKEIKRITDPIYNKFLQEASKNRVSVGFKPINNKNKVFSYKWQPHNNRLYFTFSKENFNPNRPPQPTLKKYKRSVNKLLNIKYKYKSVNYKKEHLYTDFMFCTIRVKKNQILITDKHLGKQWIRLEGTNKEIRKMMDDVAAEILSYSKKVLKTFIDLHGGKTDYNLIKYWCVSGIHGVDFLDDLPDDMFFHDTYGKKVYKKKAEIYTIPAAKNIITNNAISNVSEEIANELSEIKGSMTETLIPLNKSIVSLTNQINLHLEVMRNINKGIKNLNNSVSNLKKITPQDLINKINSPEDYKKYQSQIKELDTKQLKEFSKLFIDKFKL